MVIEKYQRIYRDEDVDRGGVQLSNDSRNIDGDVYLPGFKPRHISSDRVEEMLGMMELEFGQIEPGTPIYSYIEHGLRQLLQGNKSDWKIIHVQVQPGQLRFSIRNKKFAKVVRILKSLDGGDFLNRHEKFVAFEWQDAPRLVEPQNDVIVDFIIPPTENAVSSSLFLDLSHKRKDIEEVDFYYIYVSNETASIKEEHQNNPAKRDTDLHFSDANQYQEDIADAEDRVLIGEITEYR